MQANERGPIEFSLIFAPALAILAAAGAATLFGTPGALGIAIGFGLAWLSLLLSGWIVRSSIQAGMARVPAHARLQVLMMAKLPIFALAAYVANSLGPRSVACFLVGLLLVYFCLLVGAIFAKQTLPQPDEEP